MAPSVKALWKAATPEDQKKAHVLCMAMLEYWMGKKTKSEVAADLDLPPVRIWQLSQQALSGMLAGLLKQPRQRTSVVPQMGDEAPWELKKRIRDLEVKLSRTEDLVRVLRTAPWAQAPTESTEDKPKGGPRARAKPKAAAPLPRRANPDRKGTPRESTEPSGEQGPGSNPRSERENAS